jgi:hypothetical protein
MTRVLIGDALVNEDERLQARINQLHDRLEATLKQALRFAVEREGNRRFGRPDDAGQPDARVRRRALAPVREKRIQTRPDGVLGYTVAASDLIPCAVCAAA